MVRSVLLLSLIVSAPAAAQSSPDLDAVMAALVRAADLWVRIDDHCYSQVGDASREEWIFPIDAQFPECNGSLDYGIGARVRPDGSATAWLVDERKAK
jgi:hypothetical protein